MTQENSTSDIEFTDTASEGKVQVIIRWLTGATVSIAVRGTVNLGVLKAELASKVDGLDAGEFRLVAGTQKLSTDNTSIGELVGVEGEPLTLCVAKFTPLRRREAHAHAEWHELAASLTDQSIGDDELLLRLSSFLDEHPALVNVQFAHKGVFKSLLGHAVEAAPSLASRQHCVDELLRRGARVRIRHAQGFLLDQAIASKSAFVEFLAAKEKEFAAYEAEALQAWRNVSSKLCGETRHVAKDDEEMTCIIRDFCEKHPEMVNFQNNHAVGENDEPYGYFGYAPLMSFAGAQSCRRRRGGSEEDANVRLGSMQTLLQHGARVDMQHGNKSSLEWLESEGSMLVSWVTAQLLEPVPEQARFTFSRT